MVHEVQFAPRCKMTLADRDEVRSRDPSRAIGRNIEAFLLLEVLRAPCYGRELIRRLAEYGFRRATSEPATIYKLLRSLEDSGCIKSEWASGEYGPARRSYTITDQGRMLLR